MFRADLFLPLATFCFVTSFTPGPNNVMLMTTGLNHGVRYALPAMAGVVSGFLMLVMSVGFGLGALFTAYPVIYVFLEYAGGLYLLYLAYQIATSKPPQLGDVKKRKPLSYFQAVSIQALNPKGWVMAIGAAATYASIAEYPYNTITITAIFGFFGIWSGLAWASFGAFLQRFLHKPKTLRAFNIVMALLLVVSLYPIFLDAVK